MTQLFAYTGRDNLEAMSYAINYNNYIYSWLSENIKIDDENDTKYKPGIYNQIKAFLEAEDAMFCSIEDQLKHIDIYNKIAGYD